MPAVEVDFKVITLCLPLRVEGNGSVRSVASAKVFCHRFARLESSAHAVNLGIPANKAVAGDEKAVLLNLEFGVITC